MPADARVVHRLPGRLRLRLEQHKNRPEVLAGIAASLRACPGVLDVVANPTLGSLLIRHDAAEVEILQHAAQQGLFRMVDGASKRDVQGRISDGMLGLSRGVQTITGGEMDLDGLLVVALTGLAIQQAIEGNIMVPAAALLWNAYVAARMAPLEEARKMNGSGGGAPHPGREPDPPARSGDSQPVRRRKATGKRAQAHAKTAGQADGG